MSDLSHLKTSGHAMGIHGLGSKLGQDQQVQKLAQKFVSQAFYGTLLKQIHNSPFKSKLFDGGRGGEVFSSLLDQHLADRMAGSSANGLAQSIARHIEHAQLRAKAPPGAAKLAAQQRLAKKAYLTPSTKMRSPYVPANFRA